MKNLLSKNPHYVRGIKPNDSKSPGEFQDDLCRHQVRYLGYAPPAPRPTTVRSAVLTALRGPARPRPARAPQPVGERAREARRLLLPPKV